MRIILIISTVVLLLTTAVAGGTAATPPQTLTPDQLTVGIALPSEAFQVGIVNGARVIHAQGLEIDFARALAKQLGVRRTTFVHSRFDRLYSAGAKPWDVGIAQITITADRKRTVDFSIPYMEADEGVLASPLLATAPKTIAALRSLRICALRRSTGAAVAQGTISPTRPLRLAGNVPSMLLDLQTGRCDAVVYDAPSLATLKARAPLRYGPFLGVIETRENYGIAMAQGSALAGSVNRAVSALVADGTIERLQRKWLGTNLENLRTLR